MLAVTPEGCPELLPGSLQRVPQVCVPPVCKDPAGPGNVIPDWFALRITLWGVPPRDGLRGGLVDAPTATAN